jgi:hypothetical protein
MIRRAAGKVIARAGCPTSSALLTVGGSAHVAEHAEHDRVGAGTTSNTAGISFVDGRPERGGGCSSLVVG